MYGLKQALRSWYERINDFIMYNGFSRGKVNTTMFCKSFKNDNLIVHIYVGDIIFGSANASLCQDFSKSMQYEFEMSMMGELKFFPRIQINQGPKGTYTHQSKYTR